MTCLRVVREGKVRVERQLRFVKLINLWMKKHDDQRSPDALFSHVKQYNDHIIVCLFNVLLSDHGKQLRSCPDGQLPMSHISWAGLT